MVIIYICKPIPYVASYSIIDCLVIFWWVITIIFAIGLIIIVKDLTIRIMGLSHDLPIKMVNKINENQVDSFRKELKRDDDKSYLLRRKIEFILMYANKRDDNIYQGAYASLIKDIISVYNDCDEKRLYQYSIGEQLKILHLILCPEKLDLNEKHIKLYSKLYFELYVYFVKMKMDRNSLLFPKSHFITHDFSGTSKNVKKGLINRMIELELFDDKGIVEDTFLIFVSFELMSCMKQKTDVYEFIDIFEPIKNTDLNFIYSKSLLEYMVEGTTNISSELIELLDQNERYFVLIYLLLYHSLYEKRTTWKCFDVKTLRMLGKDILEQNFYFLSEDIKEKVKNTDIEHRALDSSIDDILNLLMYDDKFIDYLNSESDIYGVNKVYLTLIKVCVLDYHFYGKGITNSKLLENIVLYLSKHKEVFTWCYDENHRIQSFDLFVFKIKEYIKELNGNKNRFVESYPCLLISGIEVSSKLYDSKSYFSPSAVSRYALYKLEDFNKIDEVLEKMIYTDYVNEDCTIEEYVNKLCNQCTDLGMLFNNGKRISISNYLVKLVSEKLIN